MFFRKRIALWLAAHPRTSRALAFFLAGVMIVLSLVPILIIAVWGNGQ